MDINILIERLSKPDVIDLPDWEAANVLNSPDSTLPEIVEWEPTEIGVGTIMDALGPDDGANFLDLLQGSSENVLRWGMHLVLQGKLDLSNKTTRDQLDLLSSQGALTEKQKEDLLAVSKRTRFPSWSEYNSYPVNARVIGIARGGKP